MNRERLNKYVIIHADGDKNATPDPNGKIMLLGYSARKEFAAVPTFAGDGEPYLYAVLRGQSTYTYLTSAPMAYTDNVLRIHVLQWNYRAIKYLKYLLREKYENAQEAAIIIVQDVIKYASKRLAVEFKETKKYFERIYRDHTYLWFGYTEDEIDIPPFVCIDVQIRWRSEDTRLVFNCRGAKIYVYRDGIAIETSTDRVIITNKYILFHCGHVRLTRESIAMLADFGIPLTGYYLDSIRDELLQLAREDVLSVLPQPIAEEIEPAMWAKYKEEYIYYE